MAGELEAIYASLGLGNPTATANDLTSFQNNVLATDPWNIAAKALGGTQLDMRTWSPETQIGTSFGKNFLSALMGQYARNDATSQLNSVVQQISQPGYDPMTALAPEGVDESAYSTLKSNRVLKSLEAKAQADATIKDALLKVGVAGMTKQAEVMGENNAYSALGEGGAKIPGSPAYKANKDATDTLDTLRDKFNKLPEVTNYSAVNKAAMAMAGALKDKGAPSDLELVRYAVQMIEPGMAVREGEQQAVMKSQSIPEQWKGELAKTLDDGSALGQTARDGLKRLATRAYEAQKSGYDKALTYYQGLAEGRNLLNPGESISYLGEALPAESIFGASGFVEIINPKTGNTLRIPADDPRLKQLQLGSTPRG